MATPSVSTGMEADLDRTVIESVDARLGTLLGGRYRLDYKIAAGGFGAVYQAYDVISCREVAVKVLHAAFATDPTVTARFHREVAALVQLRDPHTVVAYDAGEAADGSLYLVMELIGGESLFDRFTARGPLPWQTVVKIARDVCSSLAEAHELGIVHRDLKPANIHIEQRAGERDYVKVLDFGIAKLRDGEPVDDVTHVGQMVGTFDYMAAEQMGGNCMPQSDVFALGVVMFEMIAGSRPFASATTPAEMLTAQLQTTPPLLVGVPPLLAALVARCLSREPSARYANAFELAGALVAVTEEEVPTVPSRVTARTQEAEASLNAAATVITPNPTDTQRTEVPRTTIPGVVPNASRGSVANIPHARLAAGTDVPPVTPVAPVAPVVSTQPMPMPLRLPSPRMIAPDPSPMMIVPDLRPTSVWPFVVFVAIAIAIGIAIGIGFAT